MNVPNRLTLLRILLIPVFIVLVSLGWLPGAYLAAFVVFTGACITDFLDGHIARKRDLVTDFGKFADPLADKILTTTAFIYMMCDGACHPMVLVLVITREFAVSGVRMMAASSADARVIAANLWGKVKTVVQMVAIISYYLLAGVQAFLPPWLNFMPWILLVSRILCWGVTFVTLLSGAIYIWENRKYVRSVK